MIRSGLQHLKVSASCALLALSVAMPATPALAGDWHYGVSVVCSDCHTQHNSENNQPMRTDKNPVPAAALLRRGTPLELCLSCHDGSNPSAPDVVTPVSYVPEPAGGFFPNSGGIPTSFAHHLASPTAEVPPGGTIAMVLTCTTCHDPHGNTNYRNLRPDPTQTGLPGVNVVVSQTVVANGSNPSSVYVQSNLVYKSGISAWCAQCHGALDPSSGHPVDRTIFGSTAKYAQWKNTNLPRPPVDSPADDTVPSTDDRVTCLSCHKAHGSEHNKATIYADGATMNSTCQQCHNK